MAETIRCECGAVYEMDPARAGEAFACTECGRELTVPGAMSGAEALQAQMRAARPKPSVGPAAPASARARPARKRPPAAPAAHHLGFKKVLWIPALVVGLVCVGFGGYALVTSLATAEVRIPTQAEGRWGPIFTDEKGEKYALVTNPNDPKDQWLIRDDADSVKWTDQGLEATVAGFDVRKFPASQSEKFKKVLHDKAIVEKQSSGYLWFGVAFLALGPVLVGMSLWMLRDVQRAARRQEELARQFGGQGEAPGA